MSGWAIDLGTTNTGVARWHRETDRPRLLELPAICRRPGREEPLEAPRMVPSATHVLKGDDFWTRVGQWGIFQRSVFWGRQAAIGREALALNEGWRSPGFAPSFKGALGRAPHQTLARVRQETYSARDVARIFMRELLRTVAETTGERIRDLVVTTPVESFDAYRAELTAIGRKLGIKRLRFIDEPVAAAIGYGLGVGAGRRVLVVDFGGGTLDLALVELTARDMAAGACTVLAKEGRPLGGNRIDGWLVEAFAAAMDCPLPDPDRGGEGELWYALMLDEARRVKEAVYFEKSATFSLSPPDELPGVRARLQGRRRYLDVTREQIVGLLEARSMYAMLGDCVDGIERQLQQAGLGLDAVDEVLMVGGSTLLPGVYAIFEERFGRDRVRAWQPFEAVVYGASAFSAGHFGQSDFIVHDYAFVTYDPRTHEKQYTTIVPRGTRFPTAPDLWKRQLVPTCALGEPERIFKLVICEIGGGGGERRFTWDAAGNLRRLGGAGDTGDQVIVPLNEANPALGHLDPPHEPGDGRPRLEIAFGVNADRWLIATVLDLKTRKVLMNGEPVARLL
ncbi:MAG: Hsp70 family protein [bacterium]